MGAARAAAAAVPSAAAMPAALRTLPDLLRPGLELVFVGINPSERSAARGHYYGPPGNAFWRALSASPLAVRALAPEDDTRLGGEAGIGFTDVVKRVLTDSSGVTAAELAAAAPAFRARIAAAAPRAVCFTATRPFLALYPGAWRARGWGRQPVPPLEGAEVWVMPSPSGRAAAYHARIAAVLAAPAASLRSQRPIPLPPSLAGKGDHMLVVPPPAPPRGRARNRARA